MILTKRIYRYLKFYNKRKGFIRGTVICKHLNIDLFWFYTNIETMSGIGGIGPIETTTYTRFNAIRYAKRQLFDAQIIGFFFIDGRYYCHKERPLRNGKQKPWIVKTASLKCFDEPSPKDMYAEQ